MEPIFDFVLGHGDGRKDIDDAENVALIDLQIAGIDIARQHVLYVALETEVNARDALSFGEDVVSTSLEARLEQVRKPHGERHGLIL